VTSRNLRWILLVFALAFLTAAFFSDKKAWAALGFFACGCGWYVLARRKARELDAPKPR
jgi:hypothetical protein